MDRHALNEDLFKAVEAAFLQREGTLEQVGTPPIGGLETVMYRMLTGDPAWIPATTIEKLRRAVESLRV